MNSVTEAPSLSPPAAPIRAGDPAAVWAVPTGEQGRALATLQRAFAADPPTRWIWPEAGPYAAGFPWFVRALGGRAFEAGAAHATADGRAAALWLPPGVEPDEEALMGVAEHSVPPSRRSEVLAVFEAMGRCHPTARHWYLPFIGADPSAQGQGLGSALLAHGLARCDMAGLPAYLEATSARNVPLYRRHGFETLDVLRVGTCPEITTMWREPRSRPA